MSKNYIIPMLVLFSAPLLASCSTIVNSSMQAVNFKAVGADDVTCDVLVGENSYKYTVRPPQTVQVQRSRKPMFIACSAPGNRTANMVVESSVASSAYLNTLTAGTTLAWDADTGAMFEYPEEIVIDFSSSLSKAQPLPAYENKGALDPRAQAIEYMGQDTPVLPGDAAQAARYRAAYEDAARQDALDAANAATNSAERERRIDAVEGGFYGDKGAVTPDTPIKAVPKSNSKEVQVTPLSEAAPVQPQTLTARKSAAQLEAENSGVAIPQTNPQLSKPIFPSSTTF